VAKVREKLTVSKKKNAQSSYGEVQSQGLNELEDKEQHRVEISNRFSAFENLHTEVYIN
jgi:hypothetical protein